MTRTRTRRELLVLGAGAALGLGGARLLGTCGGERSAMRREAGPPQGTVPGERTASRVYAARGQDLVFTTREAIDAMGGMGTLVRPGDRVFIKPNMVTLPWADVKDVFHTGECTKAEVIVAAAQACLGAGAVEVVVGDGSQQVSFDWSRARYLDGSTDLVTEAARLSRAFGRPVTLACLDRDSPEFIEIPAAGIGDGQILVSSLVMTADKVISIPVAKTHKFAFLSLAVKNFIGITPLRYGFGEGGRTDRWRLHASARPRDFNRLSQSIVRAVQPDLALVDFSYGMEGNGPTSELGGTPVDVRVRLGSYLILASTDLVAADSTAARVMSQDEWKIQDVMAEASDAGLGNMREDRIELVGASLAELRMHWKAADVAW